MRVFQDARPGSQLVGTGPSVRSRPDISLNRSGIYLINYTPDPSLSSFLLRMWSPRGAAGLCWAWGLGLAKQGQGDVMERDLGFLACHSWLLLWPHSSVNPCPLLPGCIPLSPTHWTGQASQPFLFSSCLAFSVFTHDTTCLSSCVDFRLAL